MPKYHFRGFFPLDISIPSTGLIRLNSTYDSTSAYRFEITVDDSTWSGESGANATADDASQQTTVGYVANGQVDPDLANDMQRTVHGDYQRGYAGADSIADFNAGNTCALTDGDTARHITYRHALPEILG